MVRYSGWQVMARRSSANDDSTPQAYHHGNLRRALLDASLELIVEQGAHSFTLREVARRAGVSHAAPYRHFADRAALIGATAQHVIDGLGALLSDAQRAAPAGAQLRAVATAYLGFALNHPARFVLAFGREAAPALITEPLSDVFREAVAMEQSATQIPALELDDRARATWAAVHGTAVLAIDGRLEPPDPELLADRLLRVLGAGLGAR